MNDLRSIFLIVLYLGFAVAVSSSETATIAVLDFENNSFYNSETYQPLTKGLAEMMNTEIGRVEAVRVVERRKLQSILDELKLSQSGMISEEKTILVGKMLGAQHLVFGGFMVMMDGAMRIDARIVEVETGLTLKAGEVTGKSKQVLSHIKKLSKKILKDLNVNLTKHEQRVFDKASKLDMTAVVRFSQGLDSEERGNIEAALAHYRAALDIEPGFDQAQERIKYLSEEIREPIIH